jgi:hypothetical protein
VAGGSPAVSNRGGASNSPTAAYGEISVRTEGRGRGCMLGEVPGHGAELLHGFGEAMVRQSGESTTAWHTAPAQRVRRWC